VTEGIKSKGIAGKVAKVMTAVRRLEKDGKNAYDNYNYITGDQAFAVIGKAMAEAGLVALPTIINVSTDTVPTKSGSQYRTIVHGQITLADADTGDTWTSDWYGEGTDRGDKSINKAMTAMMKYYLLRLFQIGSGEDADADSPEPPTEQPKPQAKKPVNVSRETLMPIVQHRQPPVVKPSPNVSRETLAPTLAPTLESDVDFQQGAQWDDIPSAAESDAQAQAAMLDAAQGLLHNPDVKLSDNATRMIAKLRELDKSSGSKAMSAVNKDGTGSGQYGLMSGKIDAATKKGAHSAVMAALFGYEVDKEGSLPGWKTKELIDWLNNDQSKDVTAATIKEIWTAIQSASTVKA